MRAGLSGCRFESCRAHQRNQLFIESPSRPRGVAAPVIRSGAVDHTHWAGNTILDGPNDKRLVSPVAELSPDAASISSGAVQLAKSRSTSTLRKPWRCSKTSALVSKPCSARRAANRPSAAVFDPARGAVSIEALCIRCGQARKATTGYHYSRRRTSRSRRTSANASGSTNRPCRS
jgi:hypothetical protein